MPADKAKGQSLYSVPGRTEPDERPEHTAQTGAVGPEICPVCLGSGMEVVPGKGARRCACRLPNRQEKLLRDARIPARYHDCTFETFYIEEDSPSLFFAFGKAQELVKQYPYGDKGLLFMGDLGVGKTHLAVAILQGLMSKGAQVLFYQFGNLLKEIQDSYNPVSETSELRVLEPVLNSEILVLDELGATKPTDWVRDTMLHIINTRYNDKRLTIFTTNYFDNPTRRTETIIVPRIDKFANSEKSAVDVQQIERIQPPLSDRIDKRMRSRLYEMCDVVEIIGVKDYRTRRKK